LRKNTTKKINCIVKVYEKSNFLAILEIHSQLRTKVSYKNSINNNNKNIIKLANNKIFNNFIKLFISFENTRCRLFIDEKISVEIQYSNKIINLELEEHK